MKTKNTTIVQFRMDSELKENFENVLKNMGLDLSGAFRIFAIQVLRNKKIPFEIKAIDDDCIFTKENEKAWEKAREELENGKAISLDEFKEKYGY